MSNLFGTLLHRISVSNKVQLIWFGSVIVIMIVLAVLHHRWKGNNKKIRLWRGLCFLPAVISAVHAFVYLRGFTLFIAGFFPLYTVSLFALLPLLFAKRKIGYKITAVITGLVTCVLSFYYLGMAPDYFNHSRESYTESFHSLVMDMDEHYR